MIGVDHRGVAEKIARPVPDYMVMGERGMADMGAMKMPLPENTLAMMSGAVPFGPLEMGGMFTVVKVRDEQKTGDYEIRAGSRTRRERLRMNGMASGPLLRVFLRLRQTQAPVASGNRDRHPAQAGRSPSMIPAP